MCTLCCSTTGHLVSLCIDLYLILLVEFVQSLDSGKFTQEELIQQLLKHFPLLHPGNDSAKSEYLKVIPKVSVSLLPFTTHALYLPSMHLTRRTPFSSTLSSHILPTIFFLNASFLLHTNLPPLFHFSVVVFFNLFCFFCYFFAFSISFIFFRFYFHFLSCCLFSNLC